MIRILRFLADFHLAVGAGFELAANNLEEFVPTVTITVNEGEK